MSLRESIVALFPDLRNLAGQCEKVYVVGGAVRDLLRGARPADVDVASTDPLLCARELHGKVVRLGRDHLSAWRVTAGGHVYDFAEILDGDIDADLARRDFTVNAMAIDLAGGDLLDPHGGRRDLERHVIRMVDASNFDDDPLRLLKAVRMAVTLEFDFDPETLDAIRPRAAAIATVAVERVTHELSLIFSARRFREAVELLRLTGLGEALGLVLPSAVHADDVPLAAALAVVVTDPRRYGKRWRWSEALMRDVAALRHLERKHDRVALFNAGERVARQLPPLLRAVGADDRVDMPDFAIRPLLDGVAIARIAGIAPGPQLGRIKQSLIDAQVTGEVRSRDEAEAFVRKEAAARPR